MEQARILVIDHLSHNRERLSTILKEQNYQIRYVTNSQDALNIASTEWAEIILLRVNLPDIDSYELSQKLRTGKKTQNIPVIFITALDSKWDKTRAFQTGGVDYLTEPLQTREVSIKLENQLKIKRAREKIRYLKEQLEIKVEAKTALLEDKNQKLHLEIKQHKQAQEKLLKLAFYDSLTGLPNRNSFLGKVRQNLLQFCQDNEKKFAVLIIKSDRLLIIKYQLDLFIFKQLLSDLTDRLQHCLPSYAILSRFESNEFAVILPSIKDEELIRWIEIVQQQFREPFIIDSNSDLNNISSQQIEVDCFIGVAQSNKNYAAAYDILHDAEIAAYQARQHKDTNYYVSTTKNQQKPQQDFKSANLTKIELAPEIIKLQLHFQESLNRNKIKISYQPIFAVNEFQYLKLVGLEVIKNRSIDYKKLMVLTEFFHYIDETKLDIYLSDFVLDNALLTLKQLQQEHETQRDFFLTMQFTEEKLLQPLIELKIAKILQNIQLAANYLHLDVIGDYTTMNDRQVIVAIERLLQLGIKINLDCSNLPYETIKNLSSLPFNSFKIDRTLVSQVTNQNETENSLVAIAKIINLAHQHNIKVTAKDIQTEEQLVDLKSIGCDYGQGELFSHPLDRESLDAFLIWRI